MPDGAMSTDPGPSPILDCVARYRGTITDIDFGVVWSADAFARAREALTEKLASLGVGSGDRVALAISNGPQFIATFAAILACGASPLLLHFKTPPGELLRYAQRFGLQFLVNEPEDDDALAGVARPLGTFEFGPNTRLCVSRFLVDDALLARMMLRGVPLHPSSGSTGAPKIAMRPGAAAVADGLCMINRLDISAQDCIFAVAPMSHIYGFGLSVMVPMVAGTNIATTRNFSVQSCAQAIAANAPTILPLTPASLDALALGRVGSLGAVRWTLSAGAMLSRGTAERFHQHTGATVVSAYGATETGGISMGMSSDEPFVEGRIGAPLKGVAVEARAAETEDDQGALTLFVRSASTMSGYLTDQDQIIDPRSQGWLPTGDLAFIDSNGVINLRGRNSDVINLAGLKVIPFEVEEAIAGLAGVVEVKVYRGQHAFGQTIVKAAVVARDGVTEADIREHCKQHLVYYKRPHTVRLIDCLPRTPVGKIDAQKLP